ncbi:MAG TPA: DUF4388 domain-containing protein [Polyangiaceae bacterium]|jgi:hypothetical protein|nr:DUF4388 domain-containing protein [Polyangiaceae bacterium]
MDQERTGRGGDWAFERSKPLEARRASRVDCDLWVRVGGVDAAARPRKGNISVTGLYVSIDEAVGSPGDVLWLSLTSVDKVRSAQTMARVTRVVRQDDLHRGAAVVGAGFEFMPIGQPRDEIVDLVRHVTSIALGMCGGVDLDHDHAVRVSRGKAPASVARLENLGRDRVVISLPAALPPGEEVRLDIAEPSGGQISVHGVVGWSEPDYSDPNGRHSVLVRFRPPQQDDDAYAARTVGALVEGLIAPSRVATVETRPQDLSGQLSRVHLASVLALAELEALDGILTVANERCAARVYFCGGRIVDAEQDTPGLQARDVLADLLTWSEGEFSFVCIAVRRSDRFEMGTHALLLELTREQDERVA